jgi:hypothetical protein
MNKNYDLRRRMNSQNQRAADISSSAADITISSCRIQVNNPGEAIVPISFSCKYTHPPTLNFGFEYHSTPAAGRSPLISASVKEFLTIDRPPNSRLYTGAEIIIVAESSPGVSFVVVATASGMAFSGPTE